MKKLLLDKLKAAAILGVSLFTWAGTQAQTNVTVNPSEEWIGAMNVYYTNGDYAFYSDWAIADIKTDLNVAENNITLYPNYNAYAAGDAYWANGAVGNKIMDAFSLRIADNLVGQDFTFSGTVLSNTLVDGYTVRAFAKALTADYQQIAEVMQPLDEPGNFTLAFNGSQYPAAVHIQYGFIVHGLNANPVNMEAYGNMVITSGAPQEPEEPEATVVTIDTSSPLIAYANWFELDGTTYVAGSVWSLPDLKTVLNTADDTLLLYPNFSAYGTGGDPYWANGEIGNKVFEGNTYVEDNTLIGQTVTFTGNVISNTLDEDYDGIGFIKILSADYQLLQYLQVPLVGGQTFSLTSETATIAGAAHLQYGYSVTGLNANPTQEAALGHVVISGATAGTESYAKASTKIYPNPTTNILNIASESVIDNVAIYNVLGQQVINRNVNSSESTLDVSSLTDGIYIINTVINGEVTSSRFVKQ